MDKIKLSLIQNSCSADPVLNLEKVLQLSEKAAKEGAQIICLQELCNTLYFCREMNPSFFSLAQTIPGPLTDELAKVAKKNNVILVVPLFEKEAPGVYYNSLAVIDTDGSIAGVYRKMHIPDDPGFYEKYYFSPGDYGYKVFNTEFGKIGTLICWDQWFPEAARITAMKGADLLVYPTAIATLPEEGDDEKKEFHDAWRTIQRSHAIANGCFVASINRVGIEGGSKFWGGSFIVGPFGQILAEGDDSEMIVSATLNYSLIETQRQTWPFFRDRRIDSYKPITKRFLQKGG